MPTMQCPGCGKAVRFEGIAGVCPNCATVVRAPRSAGAGQSSSRSKPPAAPKQKSKASRSEPASLDQLEALSQDDADPVFTPTSSSNTGYGSSGPLGLDPRLFVGIGGAIGVIVLFALYAIFKPTHAPVAVKPPPAAFPVAPPPPPPTVAPVVPRTAPPPPPKPTGTAVQILPAWYGLHPKVPKLAEDSFTDATVEQSLTRAVAYLKPFISGNNLPHTSEGEQWHNGAEGLVTFALLHAGQAIADNDLLPTSTLMSTALNRIRGEQADSKYPVYTYSVRAQLLSLANRQADRAQLAKDQDWLLRAEVDGAYGYTLAKDAKERAATVWDGSNSQYGVLGVWASLDAGMPVPARYWQDVERHWVHVQNEDGGWGYSAGQGNSTVPMSAAGLTTLCVAADQEGLIGSAAVPGVRRSAPPIVKPAAPAPPRAHAGKPDAPKAPAVLPPVTQAALTEAIDKGTTYLGEKDRLFEDGLSRGYTLYGIERAALASGYRFFGQHDWYRDLGTRELAGQSPENGSWTGRFDPPLETAFRLLFLARGRQPLLMDKLRFDGNWNNRPRDLARLTAFTSAQLERPFSWGVADLHRNWWDWLDASIIYLSTNAAPELSNSEVAKLRAYCDAGGLLIVHNEFASPDVDAFAADLAKRMYPEYPLVDAAPFDLLYRTVYTMSAGNRTAPPLKVVSNGDRPLIVYSPTDLSKDWVAWKPHDKRSLPGLEMGLNLFVAGAGKVDFRNRLNTPYVGAVDFPTDGTVPVQLVTYTGGRWNPEPVAWDRFSRWFARQTSLKLDLRPTPINGVSFRAGPIAVLTGNAPVDFPSMDTQGLLNFVRAGGTLLVDAAGGSKSFANAVRSRLLPSAFRGSTCVGMPLDHPVLTGTGDCMTPLPRPRLRKYASEQFGIAATPPGVQYLNFGAGTVIVSDLDVTNALLHSTTYGIMGYAPDYADGLYKNAILWTLSRLPLPPGAKREGDPATQTAAPTSGPSAAN